MKRLRREIKVQDLKIGMKIRFSGELKISGLEIDKTYDTVYEGEVSWIQNDGKNIFITVFLINADYPNELACVSLETERDDRVFEIREIERQGVGN